MKKYLVAKEFNEVYTKNNKFEEWSNGNSTVLLFDTKAEAEKEMRKQGFTLNPKASIKQPNKAIELLSQMKVFRDVVGIDSSGISIHEVKVLDEMWLNFGDTWGHDVNDILVIEEYAYATESLYFLTKQKLENNAFIPSEGLYAADESRDYYYFKPKYDTIIDLLKKTFDKVETDFVLEYHVEKGKYKANFEIDENGITITSGNLPENKLDEYFEPVKNAFPELL